MKVKGRIDEALALLAEARDLADRTEERYYLSELHRFTGELLMRRSASERADADAIEASLRRAVAIAREQEARSFELRATTTPRHIAGMLSAESGSRDA